MLKSCEVLKKGDVESEKVFVFAVVVLLILGDLVFENSGEKQ